MGNRLPGICGPLAKHGNCCAKDESADPDFCGTVCDCDPAGTIFDETLGELAEMDRQLLLFSSGQNLAAVRWVFALGANMRASDTNYTSSLHIACRTGSLVIVKELLRRGVPLDACDVAGWTPLHIAIFMRRQDVVLELLKAKADSEQRNNNNQSPFDMGNDLWTKEASSSYTRHLKKKTSYPWQFQCAHDPAQDSRPTWFRYEPSFVPRKSVICACRVRKAEFRSLGQHIFDRRPGQGLAFLVASGAIRDHPVDLSFFLRCAAVDMSQIGTFLGEAFSLSHSLRLEFINSMRLCGTSIVSSLIKVFALLQLPADLQKIDRLVAGIARVWWRQHEKVVESGTASGDAVNATPRVRIDETYELSGFELKQYLACPGTLYQLLFSTVMLHWNLYASRIGEGVTGSEQRVSMAEWVEINRGLESDGSDVPLHVLMRTFHAVSRNFLPQLAIHSSSKGKVDTARPERNGIFDNARLEGWGGIVGDSLPLRGVGGCMTSVLSEAHGGAVVRWHAQPTLQDSRRPSVADLGGDQVWLSLYQTFLFFATSPTDAAPFAFVHLVSTSIEVDEPLTAYDNLAMTLTLSGKSGASAWEAWDVPDELHENEANNAPGGPVNFVFLLPDGRWQEFEVGSITVSFQDATQLKQWGEALQSACSEEGLHGGTDERAGGGRSCGPQKHKASSQAIGSKPPEPSQPPEAPEPFHRPPAPPSEQFVNVPRVRFSSPRPQGMIGDDCADPSEVDDQDS